MILITRPLEDASYFQNRLSALNIESLIEPLFKLWPIHFDIDVLSDAKVIVSSKNAVRALIYFGAERNLQLYAMSDGIADFARFNGFHMVLSCGCKTGEELESHILATFSRWEKIIYLSGTDTSRDIVSSFTAEGFNSARRQICYTMSPISEFSVDARTALQDGKVKGIILLSSLAAKLCISLLVKYGFQTKSFFYFVMSKRIASVFDCETVYISGSPTVDGLVDVIERHYHVK